MGIVFLYKKGYEIIVTLSFITFYPISILHTSNLINYISKWKESLHTTITGNIYHSSTSNVQSLKEKNIGEGS
jgi:hypothetical protein